ncbi:MAG TPA: CapA family protein [Xanthomonadales bacterium]|nr:CapA family protein [Xanthomonadales bacterium]
MDTSAGEIRIGLVGQALVKKDLRTIAPAAIEQARAYLGDADVAFTNLEVAIAPEGTQLTPRSETVVAVQPEVLDGLQDMGFNLLSLANNHAADFGTAGMEITRLEVARRGFAYAGTGENIAEAAAAGYLDTKAGKVALVAMASGSVQLTPDTWASEESPGVNFLELRQDGSLNPQQKRRILHAVREAAKQSDLVIAYQHNHYWGEGHGIDGPPGRDLRTDRFATPGWMETWARELVDAGASIYVAHGNPALHGIEVYRGRLILYGLGNYIFQSAGTPDKYGPLAYYSAVVDARFKGGQLVSAQFQPLVLALDPPARGIPYLAQGGEANAVLSRLAELSRPYGTGIRIDGNTAKLLLEPN